MLDAALDWLLELLLILDFDATDVDRHCLRVSALAGDLVSGLPASLGVSGGRAFKIFLVVVLLDLHFIGGGVVDIVAFLTLHVPFGGLLSAVYS